MKTALSVFKKDVFDTSLSEAVRHAIIVPEVLNQNINLKLLDRSECETNLDYLQLIPYIVLQCKDSGKVFMYQRGSGGNEDRLHAKWSVGLGGHIEEAPEGLCDLNRVIAKCASRELNEEVGLPLNSALYSSMLEKMQTKNYSLYYNWSDAVGKVHLGVMLTHKVDRSLLGKSEKGVITKGDWFDVVEIAQRAKEKDIILETWSEFVINTIVETMYS